MRLVATINFGSVWYAEQTVPFMRRYAQRIGADFLEITRFANPAVFGPNPIWAKIEAIQFLASQSRYRSMLLLDADILILPTCPDIFQQDVGNIAIVQDMGIPNVDDRFRQWCRHYFDATPANGPYFNSGVLVINKQAAVRCASILKGPYPNGWAAEQHYLNLMLPRHEQLTWLPHSFNWLAPQFRDGSLKQNLVHFVGDHKKLLPDFVKFAEKHL